MCCCFSAGLFTIFLAISPASLRRRRTVVTETGCGSNRLASFMASIDVLSTPHFRFNLRCSTVSAFIFLGRPPLSSRMFSLFLKRILATVDLEMLSRLAVSLVERPSSMSRIAFLVVFRRIGFILCKK
ncbi:hypothetical protein K457DRAFT_897305 [Linnemannia elongata AG-77]|uniref:Secreted protein n=1 Tax=Linnemannia elongata AG-77 TaxID=1314771 RepID=A0A197JU31_9FUNG|nr:hypothetical protein K457DRAFT_897305 [Linnemannia elongata AG-77]